MITISRNSKRNLKYIGFFYCGLLWIAYIYRYFRHDIIDYNERNLDEIYNTASYNVLHRFDPQRKRDMLKGLKLSSSTYNDDILEEYPVISQNFENKENAVLLMLVRNWELENALKSMRSLEDKFNKNYHYDWVFLNDVPFDDEFIEATTLMASGQTKYALIPTSDWDRPDWIDESLFEERLKKMEEDNVIYGNSKSYRNMCRFNSGFFFRQKILDPYDYYFRVEPDVEYFCDFPYDPFEVMRKQNKKYGFVITLLEYEATIPTLWQNVLDYIKLDDGRDINMNNNLYEFLTDMNIVEAPRSLAQPSQRYNLCHFWSNFEIGDLNFFRSEKYIKFFEYLDSKGGFYYERWGDAPVHSIAANLLLDKNEIIHFDEIGYMHAPYFTLPEAQYFKLKQRCICNQHEEARIDFSQISCLTRWWKDGTGKKFMRES